MIIVLKQRWIYGYMVCVCKELVWKVYTKTIVYL